MRLLDEHRGIVHKVARAYARGDADREDLAAEIVAQLWRSFPRYDPNFRFSTWMYRVALNVAISSLRRSTRTSEVELDEARHAPRAREAGNPALDDLWDAIAELDDLNRALLLLSLDGYGYDEIAAITGLSSTNVGTKINRIKNGLRRRFAVQAQQGEPQ